MYIATMLRSFIGIQKMALTDPRNIGKKTKALMIGTSRMVSHQHQQLVLSLLSSVLGSDVSHELLNQFIRKPK